MEVAIIDYNAGNIYSVIHALQRLGIKPMLTNNAERIVKADKVIFPGQGEASNAMKYLCAHGLDNVIRNLKQPILGICIGQQLMCRHSEEGDVDCLGIFDVPVLRFQPQRHEDKVPHMGWNELRFTHSDGLRMKGVIGRPEGTTLVERSEARRVMDVIGRPEGTTLAERSGARRVMDVIGRPLGLRLRSLRSKKD